MGKERRRTDRIMFTIPLKVSGVDKAGVAFKDDARTLSLNRDGARVQIPRRLSLGQVVRITNQLVRREADFRVVGPTAPPAGEGGEWGLECVQPGASIWGIKFPPIEEGQAADGRGLLECRKCHTISLLPLSLVEVEVLETAGIIDKACDGCGKVSPWGYAEKEVSMGAPREERGMIAEAKSQLEQAEEGANRRRHRRIFLQLPVRIRDYYGGVEMGKTENVSKGGFCYASEKEYMIGQGLLAVCPYNASEQSIDIRGRVVRRHSLEGSVRKLYGIRYDVKQP